MKRLQPISELTKHCNCFSQFSQASSLKSEENILTSMQQWSSEDKEKQ